MFNVPCFVSSILIFLLAGQPSFAQVCPPGQYPVPTDGGLYGLGGGGGEGEFGCTDISTDITPPSFVTPPPKNDDPWDYSGIKIDVLPAPEKLVPARLDSGLSLNYRVTLPNGRALSVFDKPNGRRVASLNGSENEIRVRYYYTADVHNIWAGLCASNGSCGWVAADYLFSLPPGAVNLGIHRVIVPEVYAFEKPDPNSKRLGSVYGENRVAVIKRSGGASGQWSLICRLESCGWVASEFLSFDF